MSHFFQTQKVVILKTSDFNTESDDKITIKRKELCVVLFQDHSHVSEILSNIWIQLSKELPGVTMCACDMLEETTIAESFVNLSSDETSPYRNYTRHGIPFIIAYKNGRPFKLFVDVLDREYIRDFIIKLTYGKTVEISDENNDEYELPTHKNKIFI